jgi:hypothetical protein
MPATAPLSTDALPDKAAFAAANGLTYSATGGVPDFVGSMFDYLQNSRVTDVFQLPGVFEAGIVTGTIGGSQTLPGTGGAVSTSFSTTDVTTLGYIAIQLDAALPQYVLDARSNDSGPLSSIIMPIAGGQTISLEGDFDTHFTLYGPKGYETDARYVFTPDLMGLLIDVTGDYDVEIVEDKLFVYARGPFDLSSAALWQRLDRIRTVVGSKAIRQTGRYVDARPPAEGTRRLRLGFFGSRSKVGFIVVAALLSVLVVGALGIVVSVLVFMAGP